MYNYSIKYKNIKGGLINPKEVSYEEDFYKRGEG